MSSNEELMVSLRVEFGAWLDLGDAIVKESMSLTSEKLGRSSCSLPV